MTQPLSSSRFPDIAAIQTNEYYDAIVETARVKYQKYENYLESLADVEKLTPVWKERHLKIENGTALLSGAELDTECRDKVDLYIQHHDALVGPLADGTGLYNELREVLVVYDKALAILLPELSGPWGFRSNVSPALDLNTLNVLQKLKLFTAVDAKATYDKVFTQDVAQLKDQREKIQAIFDKIRPALIELKQALEPLAAKQAGYAGWSLPRGLNEIVNRAAYVKYLVALRREGQDLPSSSSVSTPAAPQTPKGSSSAPAAVTPPRAASSSMSAPGTPAGLSPTAKPAATTPNTVRTAAKTPSKPT